MRVAALCGGVGAARALVGWHLADDELTAIVNVADDEVIRGLHVSPDIDTILYHLAGVTDWERGWGIRGDTTATHNRYAELAANLDDPRLQDWFTLTDSDIATNMLRTRLLAVDEGLAGATKALCIAMGVSANIVPVTDQRVSTKIHTAAGTLGFQEYFVQHHHTPEVTGVEFSGIDEATAHPAAVAAIASAELILVPPSNPVLSIEPVLGVPGVAFRFRQAQCPKVGISPIISDAAVKGPTAELLKLRGVEVSALGVASIYASLLTHWVIDSSDAHLADGVSDLGLTPIVADIRLTSPDRSSELRSQILEAL